VTDVVLQDPLARALELPNRVADSIVAGRLASLAEANPPPDDQAVGVWIELAHAIESELSRLRGGSVDNAVAAHDVVSKTEQRTQGQWQVWVDAFRDERRTPDPYGQENPDERLRHLMFRLLPRLAEEFGFRLT
jgi:hypothetical protein